MSRRVAAGLLVLVVGALGGLAGCLSSDADFPPPQPPAAALRYKVTPPDGFPFDAYFAAWGEGYVVYAPGQAPIYLISDKKGGYVIQRPNESTAFVARREDGSGWTIMRADGPATLLLRQKDGPGFILQPPGGLPTLIDPQ